MQPGILKFQTANHCECLTAWLVDNKPDLLTEYEKKNDKDICSVLSLGYTFSILCTFYSSPPPFNISGCTGSCPPTWIQTVKFLSVLLSPGSEMCHFYQVMGLAPCDTPNTPCKPGYSCCSSSCLDKIVVCSPWYPVKVPENLCVPDDVDGKISLL